MKSRMGKRYGRAFLMTGAILSAIFAAGCSIATDQRILEVKRLVHRQHDYQAALEVIGKEVDRNPDYAPSRYWLAIVKYKLHDHAEAARQMEKALALGLPKVYHGSAYHYLGWAQVYTGREVQACQSFNRVLRIRPGHGGACHGRGKALTALGRHDAALRDLNRAVKAAPRNLRLRLDRGWVYVALQRYQDALRAFSLGVEHAPHDTLKQESLRGRGWARYGTGRFREAVSDFDAALRVMSPQNRIGAHDAWKGKALANAALGNRKPALTAIDETSERSGRGARYNRALVHYVLGETEEAKSLLGGGALGIGTRDIGTPDAAGALVVGVTPGGAVPEGIRAGDVIVACDSRPVSNTQDLAAAIRHKKVGQEVALRLSRASRSRSVVVAVEPRFRLMTRDPLAEPPEASGVGAPGMAPVLGETGTPITAPAGDTFPPIAAETPPPDEAPTESHSPAELVGSQPEGPRMTSVSEPAAPEGRGADISLSISSLALKPTTVEAGGEYGFVLELHVEDPAVEAGEEVSVAVQFRVWKAETSLFRSSELSYDFKNGIVTVIRRNGLPAPNKAGEYEIEVVCSYKQQTVRQRAVLAVE